MNRGFDSKTFSPYYRGELLLFYAKRPLAYVTIGTR